MKLALAMLATLAACGKSGNADDAYFYRHEAPLFKLMVPGDVVPPPNPSAPTDLSLWGKDSAGESREVGFSWSPLGSATDPVAGFSRHGKEKDLTKIVEQGELPGGHGKFIKILRGKMLYTHSVLTSGTFGIECTTYTSLPSPPANYVDACKTMLAE